MPTAETQTLRSRDDEELREDLESAHQALFNLRFQAATRQLAKRQLTWLRAMREVERLDCLRPDLGAEVAGRVERFLG